ncbi:DMT family transporter [Ruegeria sp. HKCCD8929]|uniref:DMT family transporter n=1 Tax=Ruegeria sp. HKCCD8929 TaxID=2683006 RepID=UPI001487AA3F|nr:DMT family transporter [Ruegeria sp. HKCCD8929]
MTKPAPTVQGLGFAFLGFAVFATHDVLIKTLGNSYSIFQIIFFATLFSFVPMTVTMLADRKVDNFLPHHPWLVLLRACLMIAGMSCAFYAFVTLPLAQVYSLLFSFPLIVTVLSVPLLGEVVRGQRWAAVGVGLIGVLVVLRPGATDLTLGHLAALTAASCSALATILVRKIGSKERSAVLILYPMLLAVLVMGMLQPAVYQPTELLHLGMMAMVGLLSVGAQHLVILAYRAAPAAVIAPSQYSQIIWATVFGALFFNERPDMYVAIGAGIIIASGIFVVWRESREDVSPRTPVLKAPNPRMDAGPSPRPKQLGLPEE